jgi:hypothetical protein
VPRFRFLGVAALLSVTLVTSAWAQFGQNKVQYRSFDWRILETEHFLIHYYTQESAAAHEAARMAERGYEYLSEFFLHEFEKKIPVILYSTHQDFEQTNVIGGFIGESTGGVTESLKGRVTLPLTGSYAELNHVLVHELVHAFQFDMMKRNLVNQLSTRPMPLWMMEGMAEWVSNGIDPVTAMWVMDAHRIDKIPTVQQMSTVRDIRVYRMGQALYEVIGKNFGPDRVRRILKRPEARRRPPSVDGRPGTEADPDSVDTTPPRSPDPSVAMSPMAGGVPSQFGHGTVEAQSLEQLWQAYADSVATALSEGLVSPDSVAEGVRVGKGYARSFNLAPSASADGNRVLFYSSRGFHNELFVAERKEDGWKIRNLVTGQQTPELESLPLVSASADWSSDGRNVVFVATQHGRDVVQIYNFEKQRIIHTLKTDLLSVANPSLSPDGRWVVFSALQGGEEDLFVVELDTDKLVRLTQDPFSERTPRFSPDGKQLVFATDRGPDTDVRHLVFGHWNLARMQLRFVGDDIVSGSVVQVVDTQSDEFSPVWGPDGKTVAFVSDRTGTYQVYTIELESGEVRQRTRFYSGVVGIVPTGPAISWSRSNHVFYSVFKNGGWHLYRTEGFPEDMPDPRNAETYELARSSPDEVHEEAELRIESEDQDYKSRLTPEYAVVGALYVGNAGAAGSGQLLLGDMLGNRYLLLAGNLRSDFDQSEILLQYASIGGRWQWGVAAYQFRDDFLVFTAPDQGRVETNILRGIGGQLYYPFNRFRRLEFLMDFTSEDQNAFHFDPQTGQFVPDSTNLSQRFYYMIPGLAFVHDNTSYSGFTPIAGGRWRAEYKQAFGDLKYNLGILDWRRYFNIKRRGALATRVVAAGSGGNNPELLRIGGPDTYRGTDFAHIHGSRVLFANTEVRFPIFPSTELLRGIVFFDVATAWTQDQPLTSELVRTAVGFGVRGFVGLPLRFDVAKPLKVTQLDAAAPEPTDWQTFFSIGFDF